jgi:hypothetical protein
MVLRLSFDAVHRGRFHAVAVWFCAAVVGCGGQTSNAAACGEVNACGGDLTGNWKVSLDCAAVAPSSPLLSSSGASLPDACKSAISQAINSAHYDASDVTASFSGTELHETGSISETVRIDFTSACMKALGATTVDTAACNQAVGGSMQGGQDGSACVAMNGGCSCSVTQTAPIDVTGTYQIEGNRFVTANGMVSSDYCVSGNTATIVEGGLGLSGRLRLTRVADAGP